MRNRSLPRRRIAGWQLLPVTLLGIAGSVRAADAPSLRDFSKSQAEEVVRIVDGDTVVLLLDGKTTTIRLIGVDTPETVHPQKPVEAYGKEASRFLRNLLAGESVYVEYEPTGSHLDKYGRTLAYLYRAPDGLFVNLEIVRQGYGHAYTRFPFQYMELFRDAERRAREAERGLWAPDVGLAPSSDASMENPAVGNSGSQTQADDATVYMTNTGSKYHRADCRYLSKSKIPISLQDAKARGLQPCSACRPPR